MRPYEHQSSEKKLSFPAPNPLSFFKQCRDAILHLLYPPICLHCGESVNEESLIFCHQCHLLLELINPVERCLYCFSSNRSSKHRLCSECVHRVPALNRIAAAFDYAGPAATLIRKMKYGNQSYLAKGAAAFLAAQLIHANWPLPEAIIPVPISFTRWLQRGYNQSLLLAKYLGELLDRPVVQALRRMNGDYSQAGMSQFQRMQLSRQSFQLIKGKNLQDRSLLLVDDVMTTGSTLRCCAETLLEECPKRIDGLTVCRAL